MASGRFLVGLALVLSACGGGGEAADLASAPDLAAGDTWTSYAQGFFGSYCTSCHTPGGAAAKQDFSMLDVVRANAVDIRCGVAPAGMTLSGCGATPAAGQFPIGNGPKPSDAERLRIVSWIEAGAPM